MWEKDEVAKGQEKKIIYSLFGFFFFFFNDDYVTRQ